jgi:peptidylprolyl isomerase
MVNRGFSQRSLIIGLGSLMFLPLIGGEAGAQAPKSPPRTTAPSTTPPTATTGLNAGSIETRDASDADVVARAGAARLSGSDVRQIFMQMNTRDQAAIERDPRLLGQAVRTMLANQLVLKEALAKKWDQQPAIAAQLDRIRQDAVVETYLRSVSQPPDGYPAEAEIENAYEANKTSFLVPRQFQLSQIVVLLAQGADKAAEDKANRKLEDVKKSLKEPGANFAAIAARDSDDPEGAAKSGDLGLLREDQIRPEIRSQIFGLAVNAVSEPVRLEDGWHILKLVDTKPAYTRPLAEVRELLQQRLREERQTANRRRYVGKLVDESPVTINEIALSRLVEKPSSK